MTGRIFSLVAILLLVGCATTQPIENSADWPKNLPSYSFYVDEYNKDVDNQNAQSLDDYLKWVVSFYNGTEFYSNGWQQTSKEAIESIEDLKERQLAAQKLQSAGQKISAEWAKSNKFRLITTRHVSIWGMSLEEAIAQGQALSYIDHVQRDIDAVLAGRIEPNDITNYRYFAESEDFFF